MPLTIFDLKDLCDSAVSENSTLDGDITNYPELFSLKMHSPISVSGHYLFLLRFMLYSLSLSIISSKQIKPVNLPKTIIPLFASLFSCAPACSCFEPLPNDSVRRFTKTTNAIFRYLLSPRNPVYLN